MARSNALAAKGKSSRLPCEACLKAFGYAEVQTFGAVIHGDQRQVSLTLQTPREITGSASRFQRAMESAAFQMGSKQAELYRAHAAVPPETLLVPRDVCEFRRIEAALRSAITWPRGVVLLNPNHVWRRVGSLRH